MILFINRRFSAPSERQSFCCGQHIQELHEIWANHSGSY